MGTATDGKRRCLPGTPVERRYADAECSAPVLVVPAGACPPGPLVRVSDAACEPSWRVLEVGAERASASAYALVGAECKLATIASSVFDASEINPADMALVSIEID